MCLRAERTATWAVREGTWGGKPLILQASPAGAPAQPWLPLAGEVPGAPPSRAQRPGPHTVLRSQVEELCTAQEPQAPQQERAFTHCRGCRTHPRPGGQWPRMARQGLESGSDTPGHLSVAGPTGWTSLGPGEGCLATQPLVSTPAAARVAWAGGACRRR